MADAYGADDSSDMIYAEYSFGIVDNPVYSKKSVSHHLIVSFEIDSSFVI